MCQQVRDKGTTGCGEQLVAATCKNQTLKGYTTIQLHTSCITFILVAAGHFKYSPRPDTENFEGLECVSFEVSCYTGSCMKCLGHMMKVGLSPVKASGQKFVYRDAPA